MNRPPQNRLLSYAITSLFCTTALLAACETNDGNADVQIVDTEGTTFDGEENTLDDKPVIDGCEWAGGIWTMKTCRNASGFNFTVQMSGCDADIASDDDYLKDATGTVQDSGMTLALQSGEMCHAFWDGAFLVGACSFTAQDLPCWLIAAPQ